jgi:hypothetical protein
MEPHPDTEQRKPAVGYFAAPFHLTQNEQARPWTIALLFAVRPAFRLVGPETHHNRGAMDGGLRAFKACTGMAEVAHPGVVLLRLVEVRPFKRRTAGEPLFSSFVFRHALLPIKSHASRNDLFNQLILRYIRKYPDIRAPSVY